MVGSLIAKLQICQLPSPAIDWKIWKALYLHGWSVVRSVVTLLHSDVTLAIEDALI